MANTVEIIIKALDTTRAGFTSATRNLDGFRRASGVALTAATTMAAAVGAAYVAMAKNFADSADEMGKLSQKTGETTDYLSRLKFVAEENSIEWGSLQKALRSASDEAAKSGQSFSQLLDSQADRFASFADGAGKAAEAQRIFGKSGSDLIPLLNLGSQGLKQATKDAERFTTIIDSQTAATADEFGDTLERVGASLKKAFMDGIKEALPFMLEMSRNVLGMVDLLRDADGTFKTFSNGVAIVGKTIALASQVALNAGNTFKNFLKVFGSESVDDALKNTDEFWRKQEDGWTALEKLWNGDIQLPTPKDGGSLPEMANSKDSEKLKLMYEDLFNSQLHGSAKVFAENKSAHQKRMAQVLEMQVSLEEGAAFEALSAATVETQKAEFFRTGLALRADMETAYNEGSLERTQLLLEGEQAQRMAQLEGNRTLIDAYVEQWRIAHQTIQSFAASLSTSFSQNLGGAISDIIQNIGNAGDAAKRFGQAMLNSITNFIGQWVAAQITMRIMQAVFATTTAATSVAAAAAIGAAWAPAAALASLASFGANAGPASAAIASTVAVSKAASVFGGAFHGGTDFVPAEQSYLLNRGERVIQPSANEDLTSFLDGQGGGGTIVEVHLDGEVLARGIGNLSRDGRLSIAARSVT